MVVLQQLKLSIEKSHNTNDGNAKGGGEEHFVELFFLVSDLGLRQSVSMCGTCYKSKLSEELPEQ